MNDIAKGFLWTYGRAFIWILVVTLTLRRALHEGKIAKAFFAAHMIALGFGIATDLIMLNVVPKRLLTIDYLQWVFVMPIVIFTVISLWISNWKRDVKIPDVLVTIVPIAWWGLLVIYGWQNMWYCHVLGAWFVSAACGAVDLYVRYGPPWASRRSFTFRLAGYAVVTGLVYLLLPLTERA